MSEPVENTTTSEMDELGSVRTVLEKLLATASPDSAFGAPITVGEYTIIPAAEVVAVMGTGFGGAYGPEACCCHGEEPCDCHDKGDEGKESGEAAAGQDKDDKCECEGECTCGDECECSCHDQGGQASGAGGGGTAMSRPVAVIAIGPQGVQVKPVVDVTKVGIALFTAVGAMWLAIARMNRLYRG
jgi:uncharacterized spore protein YtfJ